MSEPQHTPGPWSVGTCSDGEACWCRTIMLAGKEKSEELDDCVIHAGAVNKRDAALISAAPELYEVLKAIGYWPSVRAAIGDKLCAQLDAVITKAGGQ